MDQNYYVTCYVANHKTCYVGKTFAASEKKAAQNIKYRIKQMVIAQGWPFVSNKELSERLYVHSDAKSQQVDAYQFQNVVTV